MLSVITMTAQAKLHPCGSHPHKSDWLIEYQKNPSSYSSRSGTTLYVPLKLHVVSTDDGVGSMPIEQLYKALCTLREDYLQADIEFFLQGEVDYIKDSDFFEHESVNFGAAKMQVYNEADAINCYIVKTAAGNCGYNIPYAGVVVAINCLGSSDHTWAHEIGHNLALPHTFLGWEGGVSHDGSVAHNFDNPAPSTVTYNYTDFKDRPYPDTLIIDTAFVELVDRSNCNYAADGFCDTEPDYLALRWSCDAEGLSVVEQTDPNGDKFKSDGSKYHVICGRSLQWSFFCRTEPSNEGKSHGSKSFLSLQSKSTRSSRRPNYLS